jgi:hypothetical protein
MQVFLIRFLHVLFIMFMLLGWVSNDPQILLLYIVTSISLKVHWCFSDDTCALTLLEQMITNVDKHESFMYKIVNPIYKIEDDVLSECSKLFTSIFLLVSLYKFKKLDGVEFIKKNILNIL